MLFGPGFNTCLNGTFVRYNVGRQLGCPRDTENKDTLCTHLGVLGPAQPP